MPSVSYREYSASFFDMSVMFFGIGQSSDLHSNEDIYAYFMINMNSVLLDVSSSLYKHAVMTDELRSLTRC